MNKKLPQARNTNIVVQNLDNEVLIYDLDVGKAFCLNETAAKVFNCCNGKMTFDELKNKFQLTDDVILLTLDELGKRNLLAENTQYQFSFSSSTRREIIKKIGLSSMIALPLISSIIAPTSAQAASLLPILASCTQNSECASDYCVTNNSLNICCSPESRFHYAPNIPLCIPNCNSTQNYWCCSGSIAPGTANCLSEREVACVCQ